MPADELPDDIRDWPSDWFAILGVSRAASAREIRRAYAARIRIHKPERSPEKFRRIREAYESLIRYAGPVGPPSNQTSQPTGTEETADNSHAEPPAVSDATDDGGAPAKCDTPNSAGAPAHEARYEASPAPLDAALATTWEQLVRGETDAAYRAFRELRKTHPRNREILIRMYWVVALHPELDGSVDACELLAEGIRLHGPRGALGELYRRELTNQMPEAVGSRATSVLRSLTDVSAVWHFLDTRWHMASRLSAWFVLADDVAWLKTWMPAADEQSFARIIFRAVDYLAWSEKPPFRAFARELGALLQGMKHLQLRLAAEFDRMDELFMLADDWHAAVDRGILSDVMAIIPRAWNRSDEQVQLLLQNICAQAALSPGEFLNRCDIIEASAPPVLALFRRVLEQNTYFYPPADSRGEETTRMLAIEIARSVDGREYDRIRGGLIAFCIRESIAPETVAAHVAEQPLRWRCGNKPLGEWITKDLPIQCLYHAQRRFWLSNESSERWHELGLL